MRSRENELLGYIHCKLVKHRQRRVNPEISLNPATSQPPMAPTRRLHRRGASRSPAPHQQRCRQAAPPTQSGVSALAAGAGEKGSGGELRPPKQKPPAGLSSLCGAHALGGLQPPLPLLWR